MLKIDARERKLVPADNATLTTEAIGERSDLQAFIIASWDAFIAEIGMPDLMYPGSEVVPHSSCGNRIDILASDPTRLPLAGIDDVYVARRQATTSPGTTSQTWEDVKGWVACDWGPAAIDGY